MAFHGSRVSTSTDVCPSALYHPGRLQRRQAAEAADRHQVRQDLEGETEVLLDGVVGDAEADVQVRTDAGNDQRVGKTLTGAEVVGAAGGDGVLGAENVRDRSGYGPARDRVDLAVSEVEVRPVRSVE